MPHISVVDERETNYRLTAQALLDIEKCQTDLAKALAVVQGYVKNDDSHIVNAMLGFTHEAIRDTKLLVAKARDTLPTRTLLNKAQIGQPRRPVQKLLKTTELVEMVLHNLDVEDLLRVQQVNRRVFDVIKGSETLQQKMLLLPSPFGPFATFLPNKEVKFTTESYFRLRRDPGPIKLWNHRLKTCIALTTLLLYGKRNMPATFDFEFHSNKYLSQEFLGERVRSMLI